MESAEAGEGKAETALLIRDGFSMLAAILPLIWFLWHRMWLEALVFVVAGLVIAGLGSLIEPTFFPTALSLLLAIFIGLEAQALRAAALRRRGWHEWGVVEGANREEAEWHYAMAKENTYPRPAAAAPSVPTQTVPAGRKTASPALGLIDYPRKT